MSKRYRTVRLALAGLLIVSAMLVSGTAAGATRATSTAAADLPPCLHNPVNGKPMRCGLTAMAYYYGVGIVVTRAACALESSQQRSVCGTPAGYCVYNVFTGQPMYCEHQTKVIPALVGISQMLVECARDPQC